MIPYLYSQSHPVGWICDVCSKPVKKIIGIDPKTKKERYEPESHYWSVALKHIYCSPECSLEEYETSNSNTQRP